METTRTTISHKAAKEMNESDTKSCPDRPNALLYDENLKDNEQQITLKSIDDLSDDSVAL
jgi:hypothetical protein